MADFLKQTDRPLFPDILWSTPLNRKAAKSLLIIGGHKNHFKTIEQVYNDTRVAGIGQAKLAVPDSLGPLLGQVPNCLLVKSTLSGSLGKGALDELTVYARESDGVILAGDFSHNPETISLLESLLLELEQPLAISQEAIYLMLHNPRALFSDPSRLLVADTQTFIKLANALNLKLSLNRNSSLLNKIDFVKQLQSVYSANYILVANQTLVSTNSGSSVTNLAKPRIESVVGWATTYWLQHADNLQALSSAVWQTAQVKA